MLRQRIPGKRQRLEALRKILDHGAIVRLPDQHQGMIAITQDQITMQLAFDCLPVAGLGGALGGKSVFTIAAGIDDHDAIGVGRIHEFRAR